MPSNSVYGNDLIQMLQTAQSFTLRKKQGLLILLFHVSCNSVRRELFEIPAAVTSGGVSSAAHRCEFGVFDQ